MVSFRLGGTDGVSVEAAKWADALAELGFEVRTVAGEGPVDVRLPGLAIDAPAPPDAGEVDAALAGCELVVVENLCSLPLNAGAARVVAGVLAGRPAVLHHHDLPWQRPRFADHPAPPDDRAWAHVTINELSRRQLAGRGIAATTVMNTFDVDAPPGDRHGTRGRLGLRPGERLLLQPTRALERKNVPGGLRLAEQLGATYWLLGGPEDGFGPALDRILAAAGGPVVRGVGPAGAGSDVADAYAAADAVVLPSTWEGFGNPAVESAVHRRPLAIGPYPVAVELVARGFRWFTLNEVEALDTWLAHPDTALVDHNQHVARRSFNRRDLPARLRPVLAAIGIAVPAPGPGPPSEPAPNTVEADEGRPEGSR
jgi:mannosylglucosylglycerate synthase